MNDLVGELREEHRKTGTLDTNDIAYLFTRIESLERDLAILNTEWQRSTDAWNEEVCIRDKRIESLEADNLHEYLSTKGIINCDDSPEEVGKRLLQGDEDAVDNQRLRLIRCE